MSDRQPGMGGNIRAAGFCGKCGYPLKEGFQFCGRCGAPAPVLPPAAAPEVPADEPRTTVKVVKEKPALKGKRIPKEKREPAEKTPKRFRTGLIIAAAVLVLSTGVLFLLNALGVITLFGPKTEAVRPVTASARDIDQGEAAQLLGIASEQVDDFYSLPGDDPNSKQYVLTEKKVSDYCRMVRDISLELKHQKDGTWQGTPVYGSWQAEWHMNGKWQLQSPGEITVRVLEANATTIRMEYSAVIGGKPYYGANSWYSLDENRGGDTERCVQAVKQPDSDMPGEFRLSDQYGIIYFDGSREWSLTRTETDETDDWKTEDEDDSMG